MLPESDPRNPLFVSGRGRHHGGWRFLLPAALVVMFVLGGGSAQVPVEQVAAEIIGAVLLGWILFGLNWRDIAAGDRFALGLLLALGLVFVAQLVPLPPTVWTGFPGREIFAAGDRLMFGQPISRPWSLDPDETRAAALFLAPAVAVWLAMRVRPGVATSLLLAYLAALLLSLILALAQVMAGPGQLHLYANTQSDLPTGVFANRNHQAIAMVCGIPLAGAMHRMMRRRRSVAWRSWMFPAVATGFSIGALLTGSRTGGVLLLPGLAGGLAIAYAEPGTARLKQVRRWAIVGGGALAVLVAIVSIRGAKAGGALGLVFSRNLLEADQRYDFWPSVAAMWHTYAPWGTGLGTFRRVYEVTEPDALLGPLYLNHAHCDWLEFVVETGVAGIALVAGFLIWLTLRFRAVRRAGLDAAPMAHAASLVVLLLLAHSVVDYPLRTVTMACVMAASLALIEQRRPREGAES